MGMLPPLSVQLWSVRAALAADVQRTFAELAEIGLTRVEPFDLLTDTRGLGEALAAYGLSAPSAHAHLTGGDLGPVFEAAAALGVVTVVEPMVPPDRWGSVEDIQGIADDLGRAAEQAARLGLRVGYHNHAFELERTIDGRPVLELLAERLDPAVVLQVDTYWAAVGGQDVPALLGRLGDRVRSLHLKDGPITAATQDQLPWGSGRMPVDQILEAAPALELPVLEFDDYRGDVFEGIRAGFAFATGFGQAR